MNTYQVNILNPKADKLLKNLAELELISISEVSADAKEVTQHAMNLAQESLAEDWNSKEDEHWESFL